jgi:hypothetical protein
VRPVKAARTLEGPPAMLGRAPVDRRVHRLVAPPEPAELLTRAEPTRRAERLHPPVAVARPERPWVSAPDS